MSELRNNATASRYEMDEAGETLFADYRCVGGQLVIDHVEAPAALRGTGAAGRFMEALALQARREGVKIIPLCAYAMAWLKRNQQYADLTG